MLARAHAFTIDGLDSIHVSVEIDVRQGLPAFNVVGLADASIREARERVRSAIRNSGYEFPARRITANLAPGDLRKAGSGLDLSLACAILAASGQVPVERLNEVALFGELALDGSVLPSRGALAVSLGARRAGLPALALARPSAREAALVEGIEVLPVGRLRSATSVLAGDGPDPLPSPDTSFAAAPSRQSADLNEVRGQGHAVRALLLVAAGGHNMLISGPPGSGKTMLARRLPGILTALDREEMIDVARIRSLAGWGAEALTRTRPFRAPQPAVGARGLVGAAPGAIGEVVLAHHGVLFLDELSEFARPALDALRQPLEDGRLASAPGSRRAIYPSRFALLAAMNPCACGYASELERCRCNKSELQRHRRHLSGPLLDRLDLLVEMRDEPTSRLKPEIDTAGAREGVLGARARQARRLQGTGARVNAHMDLATLRAHVRVDARGDRVLADARQAGTISARGEHRVLRVARTIADLDGRARVRAGDIATALTLRTAHPLARRRGP